METVPGEEPAASDICEILAPKVAECSTLVDLVVSLPKVVGESKEAKAIVLGDHSAALTFVGPMVAGIDGLSMAIVGANSSGKVALGISASGSDVDLEKKAETVSL